MRIIKTRNEQLTSELRGIRRRSGHRAQLDFGSPHVSTDAPPATSRLPSLHTITNAEKALRRCWKCAWDRGGVHRGNVLGGSPVHALIRLCDRTHGCAKTRCDSHPGSAGRHWLPVKVLFGGQKASEVAPAHFLFQFTFQNISVFRTAKADRDRPVSFRHKNNTR